MAHACPDKWLTPHRIGGSAAREYSTCLIEVLTKLFEKAEINYIPLMISGSLMIVSKYLMEKIDYFCPNNEAEDRVNLENLKGYLQKVETKIEKSEGETHDDQ